MNHDPLVVSLKKPAPELPREPRREPDLPPPRRKKKQKFSRVQIILGVLALLAIGWGIVHFTRGGTPSNSSDATKEQIQKEANDLVAEVGKLILLPTGEVPTIATVSDTTKLKGQAFFQNAQVGDKVLIYTVARKAYLYRPSQHLLIEVAPITTDVQP